MKTVLSLLSICFCLWLGAKFLLPLCFPFLLGGALALGAEPGVRLLCGRLRFPRPLAAAAAVTAVFLGCTLLVLMLLAFLVRELGLLTRILPDLSQTAGAGIDLLHSWLLGVAEKTPPGIRPLVRQNVDALFSGGTALLEKGLTWLLGLAGGILTQVPDRALTLGTAVISGYMISGRLPAIRGWLLQHFPREKLRPVWKLLGRLRRALGCWIGAQLRLLGVTFVILLAGLMLLRIPYSLLWAAGIALVDAVPVLGTGTVLLPWSLICFLQGDNPRAVGLLGIYGILFLTRSTLEPRLLGRQLGLDPLVTLAALYAGYRLWGIAGMILSPLIAVTVVQLLPGSREK